LESGKERKIMLRVENIANTNKIKQANTKTQRIYKPWEDPFYIPQKRINAYERGVRKFIPGAIRYGDMEIPIYKILCMRDSEKANHITPKTVITFLMPNPKDDDSNIAVEYEFSGSLREWADAYEQAGDSGNTVDLII